MKSLLVLTALIVSFAASAAPKADSQPAPLAAPDSQGVVNINTASIDELTRIPGIGSSKAEAIVAFRDDHPFKDVSELDEVHGIGPKMMEKIAPYLTIEGPTTLRPARSK